MHTEYEYLLCAIAGDTSVHVFVSRPRSDIFIETGVTCLLDAGRSSHLPTIDEISLLVVVHTIPIRFGCSLVKRLLVAAVQERSVVGVDSC